MVAPEHLAALESLADASSPAALRRRARLILLCGAGRSAEQAAGEVGLSPGRVRYWLREYQRRGLDIFPDAGLPTAGTRASSPGLDPDDSLAEAGRKTLRFHFDAMLANEPGTRLGDDIEALHDMRVAIRRMRSAFAIFEPAYKKKTADQLQRGLRRTARALGPVRDLDVLLEKARNYQEALPAEEQAALDSLLNPWRRERKRARRAMLAYLDSKRYERFKGDFSAFLDSSDQAKRQGSRRMPRPSRLRDVVPALVYTRLAGVRAFEPALNEPSVDLLHALRIEFKKLRYAVEFFREVLGPEAKDLIKELKGIQDHLGDLNDADIAAQMLGELIKKGKKQPRRGKADLQPLVRYREARLAERERLRAGFPDIWVRFTSPALRRKLAGALAEL